jgi:hypothetical protein
MSLCAVLNRSRAGIGEVEAATALQPARTRNLSSFAPSARNNCGSAGGLGLFPLLDCRAIETPITANPKTR